jgi:hypothetical protein
VEKGFSGAAVYDSMRGIIGMIVESDRETERKIAQFIDGNSLLKAVGLPEEPSELLDSADVSYSVSVETLCIPDQFPIPGAAMPLLGTANILTTKQFGILISPQTIGQFDDAFGGDQMHAAAEQKANYIRQGETALGG